MTCKEHKKSDYNCQDCFNTIMDGMEEVNGKYTNQKKHRKGS